MWLVTSCIYMTGGKTNVHGSWQDIPLYGWWQVISKMYMTHNRWQVIIMYGKLCMVGDKLYLYDWWKGITALVHGSCQGIPVYGWTKAYLYMTGVKVYRYGSWQRIPCIWLVTNYILYDWWQGIHAWLLARHTCICLVTRHTYVALGKAYLYMTDEKAYLHGSWLGIPAYGW